MALVVSQISHLIYSQAIAWRKRIMPLPNTTREEVLNYCKRDLPNDFEWYQNEFDFVLDNDLREELAKAFYSSRYIYKLMEGLAIVGNELHAHLKFQIMQYASIYEAVINRPLAD